MSTAGGFTSVSFHDDFTINIDGKSISFGQSTVDDFIEIANFACNKLSIYTENSIQSNPDSIYSEKFEKFVNRFIEEIPKISLSIKEDSENISTQYLNFIRSIYFQLWQFSVSLPDNDYDAFNGNYQYNVNNFDGVLSKLTNLSLMAMFSGVKEGNIVIIGGNGSGKSTFAGYLKDFYSDEMVVIPAQKILLYDSSFHELSLTQKKDINQLHHENMITSLHQSNIYLQSNSIASAFSKIVVAIVNTALSELKSYADKCEKYKSEGRLAELEEPDYLFDKIKRIWSLLIPNIQLDFDPVLKCIFPIDANGEKYPLNSMSDGQKALIYYIGNILLADKHSYIVVDEPETHLNPSVYKRLWDLLEEEKPDCQFVYISHDIEFVRTRKNITLFWMEKYLSHNSWSIKRLSNDQDIPMDVMLEIYGSKNKILFCEGDKEHSYDYEIYSHLFDDYTVIPVGGCPEVVKYTDAFNAQNQIHNNEAIGLVDFDNRSEAEIEGLHRKHVYETKYNEIEMLLCDEAVIRSVLKNFSPEDIEKKVIQFKKEFFEKVESEKERISRDYIRNRMNSFLDHYKINEKDDFEQMKLEFHSVPNLLDVDDEYQNYLNKIEKELDDKNYENLLMYCNLKGSVADAIGNKLIGSYSQQARRVIWNDLKENIKSRYFNFIP